MFNYLKRFSLSGLLVIFLAIFTVINPNTGLDILAFLIIIFIILQKIFSEYFILILLAARPTLDYWRDFNLFSFKTFDFNINAALSIFLLIWSVYFFVKNRRYFKSIPTKITWLLFIVWISLTAIYSYDLASTIREAIKAANLFGLFGICYIMSAKDKTKFKKYFLKALIAASIIPLLAAIYQFFSKTGLEIDGVANRIYGTFAHPNILASFALLLLMVLVNESGLAKNWSKLLGVFLLGIIALTYTRIAWIGALVFFIIVGMVYYKKLLVYALIGVALFYALFYPFNNYLITSYNFNLQSFNLISRLTARNEDSDSIKWRTDVASRVLPLFKKKFILGYGYGSFPRVWDDNKDVGNIWDRTSEAHDDYIKIAFESGIIGLVLFLSIFINLLYNQIGFAIKNIQRRVSMDATRHDFVKSNIVFIASIVIYLILSLSDNMLHHTPMIWWLWAVWGLWAAEYNVEKNKI